jgi:hypothetical protein
MQGGLRGSPRAVLSSRRGGGEDAEVTAVLGTVSEWRMVLGCVGFSRDVIHRGEAMAATSDTPDREEWRG